MKSIITHSNYEYIGDISVTEPDECGEIDIRQNGNIINLIPSDYFKLGFDLGVIACGNPEDSITNCWALWTIKQKKIYIEKRQAIEIIEFLCKIFE